MPNKKVRSAKAYSQKKASRLIKAELAKRGVGYAELQRKLMAMDIKETANSINVKINRGTFSFAFFLQVMEAIEGKVLRLVDE